MPILKQAPNKLYPGSLIRSFLVNSTVYEHVIFPNEDDRVECRNMYGEVILTYTSDCQVLDKHKRQIGKFSTDNNGDWYFSNDNVKKLIFSDNLLEAEIGVSEMYIRGEL